MTDSCFEAEAASVEEASQRALAEAGLAADQALVEVLSAGRAAVSGERISGGLARVRVRALPRDVVEARQHLRRLLHLMEVDAQVTVTRPAQPDGSAAAEDGPLALLVDGADLGVLIGWRGESLRALQTVVNLMLKPEAPGSGTPRVIVDVAHYRERRERTVTQMALRLAADVQRSGRSVMLDPMPPYERRAVHMALALEPGVTSESTGVDEGRRVVIRAAESAPAADQRGADRN
ncbi:MAG: Jag family protein [Candidatus Dormibacteria bacterium]